MYIVRAWHINGRINDCSADGALVPSRYGDEGCALASQDARLAASGLSIFCRYVLAINLACIDSVSTPCKVISAPETGALIELSGPALAGMIQTQMFHMHMSLHCWDYSSQGFVAYVYVCLHKLAVEPLPADRRTAMHLQLTTELVSAASGADAKGAPESMWQHTGASALQHAAEWSSELLAVLTDCSAEALTGEAEPRVHEMRYASQSCSSSQCPVTESRL